MSIEEVKKRSDAKAIEQILRVLDTFGFEVGSDIRLGSLALLFEEGGVTANEVDSAIGYMFSAGWLEPLRG